MGEAKRRKVTDADVEHRIAQAVDQVRSELSKQNPEMANVAGRIYTLMFGSFERAIHQEKALQSDPRMVIAALESVLLTIIGAMSEELIKPDKRLFFIETLTKRIELKLTDFVQGNVPQGMKVMKLNDKAN